MPDPIRTCKSCGAAIIWRQHPATKSPMPLNAEPDPNGSMVLVGDKWAMLAQVATNRPRYMPHFATCPNAAAHRKGGQDR